MDLFFILCKITLFFKMEIKFYQRTIFVIKVQETWIRKKGLEKLLNKEGKIDRIIKFLPPFYRFNKVL